MLISHGVNEVERAGRREEDREKDRETERDRHT